MSEWEIRRAEELWKLGWNYTAIARELGRDIKSISRRLRKVKKPPPKRHTVSPEEAAEMVALKRAGMAVSQIAARFNFKETTVRGHLALAGLCDHPAKSRSAVAQEAIDLAEVLKMREFEQQQRLWMRNNPVGIGSSMGDMTTCSVPQRRSGMS